MAACEVSSDVPSADARTSEDELDIAVSANETELFQKDIGGLTVGDVYNMAASIGKEFEKLTDAFGGAIFSDIMPKIIRVLEMLESYASKSQNYSTDVVELQATIQRLQIDKKAYADNHREDLDMVENAWRDEIRQLLQTVETLKEDNKRLTQLLTEKLDRSDELENANEQPDSVVGILGESVEKQRDKIREKNRLIEQQVAECEALSSQAQQMTKLNVNLRRKISMMEKQASSMADQSTDLESTCREKDRQIKDLQKRVSELAVQLNNNTPKPSPSVEVVYHAPSEPPADPLLANKLVIDLNDPERPRYTMSELQEVLSERNTFKLKCILLEDELGFYKQKEESWEEIQLAELRNSPGHEVNNNSEHNHKSESAIKKLFASIFSRNARSPAIPYEARTAQTLPYFLYDRPLLDMSDVMPTIDITPSPEEHDTPLMPPNDDEVDNEFKDIKDGSVSS